MASIIQGIWAQARLAEKKWGPIYYSSGNWHGCDMHQRLLAAYGKLTHDTHTCEVKSPYP